MAFGDYGVKHVYADNERYKATIQVIPSELVMKNQTVEEGEDTVFLHLTVNKWDKTTLNMLRIDLEDVLKKSKEHGIECVSFVVSKLVGTKFHNLVKKLDYEVDLEDHYLGGWYTP